MKKFTAMILALILAAAMLAGCGSSVSYEYAVLSGDTATITLDTSDGHEMTQAGDFFIITKDGVENEGFFIEWEMVDDYFEGMPTNPAAEVLEWGENDWGTFMLYTAEYGGITEWGIVLRLDGTNSGMYMYNTVSEEAIRDAFAHLSFSVETAD